MNSRDRKGRLFHLTLFYTSYCSCLSQSTRRNSPTSTSYNLSILSNKAIFSSSTHSTQSDQDQRSFHLKSRSRFNITNFNISLLHERIAQTINVPRDQSNSVLEYLKICMFIKQIISTNRYTGFISGMYICTQTHMSNNSAVLFTSTRFYQDASTVRVCQLQIIQNETESYLSKYLNAILFAVDHRLNCHHDLLFLLLRFAVF